MDLFLKKLLLGSECGYVKYYIIMLFKVGKHEARCSFIRFKML